MAAVLTSIHIHPVKSCRRVEVERVEVTRTGLRGDRVFQVVDADGAPLTQRQHRVLATVQPALVADRLELGAPGRASVSVAIPTRNDTTVSSLLGVPVDAADAGDEVAEWFTDLLGEAARLVAMTESSDYRVPVPGMAMTPSWSDAAEVLVANQTSLDWLVEHADEPFGIDRFRPNLIVTADEPWVEDTWREFSIGGARFGGGFAWPRCAIPQVDQSDGTRHPEPARVLKRYRWCTDASGSGEVPSKMFEGNALFGIGCSIGPIGAEIVVGDAVTVEATGVPLIAPPT